MSKKEEEAAPAAAAGDAPPAGPNKLVMILTIVNVVVSLGMVGVLFMSYQRELKMAKIDDITLQEQAGGGEGHGGGDAHGGGGDAHGGGGHGGGKEAQKKKIGDHGQMIGLDQFTVNLSTPGSIASKFARVNISLEVSGPEMEAEVTAKMPQIRNVIIDLFNSKRPTDLAAAEGRDYLKEEIRNALNSFLTAGKVKGVFFTNFAFSG